MDADTSAPNRAAVRHLPARMQSQVGGCGLSLARNQSDDTLMPCLVEKADPTAVKRMRTRVAQTDAQRSAHLFAYALQWLCVRG